MKISLFSQSLFALDLDDAIAACAEAGYPAIELACRAPHLSPARAESSAEDVADRVRQAGLEVSALSLYNDFTTPGTLIPQIREAERFIRLAPTFQADVVKLTPGPPSSSQAHEREWDNLRSAIDLLAPAARNTGVRLAFETHMNQLADTLASSTRLLAMTNNPAVGITVDFSNLAFAGEEMPRVVSELGDRIYHAHVKNVRIDQDGSWLFGPLDEGLTDYAEVIPLLRDIGYTGYLSVECLGPDAQTDPVGTCRRDLEVLKAML